MLRLKWYTEHIYDTIVDMNKYLKEIPVILSNNYIDDENVVSYVVRMKIELQTALRNTSWCFHEIVGTSSYLHSISLDCKEDVDDTK